MVETSAPDALWREDCNLQLTTIFSAAILESATKIDVAKALISFLRTQDAVKVIRTKRLEPATP